MSDKSSRDGLSDIEIAWQHDDVANGHVARSRQHEQNCVGDLPGLDQRPGRDRLFEVLLGPVGDQRRDHRTRRDRAYANPVLQNLTTHRLDKAGHRPLRGGIDGLPGNRKMPGDGTGHDDVAVAPLDHVRQNVVHVLDDDVDIEIEHPVNHGGVSVDEISADVRAGVRVQNVDRMSQTLHWHMADAL
jgi:hypothetical protein